jgi:hypothetical protein
MNEFKLEFYFNKYKNHALPNRDAFRCNFKKEHGNFEYLEELILRIEDYQFKKYGCTLPNDTFIKAKSTEECNKEKRRVSQSRRRRLGL